MFGTLGYHNRDTKGAQAMTKTKFVDRLIEAFIVIALGAAVNALVGIRNDLNDVSQKLGVIVEKVQQHDVQIKEQKEASAWLRDKIGQLEIKAARYQ